jgi:hypothetical protein
VPAVLGVPLITPLLRLKLTPFGSDPETVSEGAGEPKAVTLKDPKVPRKKVAWEALVNAGAVRLGAPVVVVVVVGGIVVVVVVVVGATVVVVVGAA